MLLGSDEGLRWDDIVELYDHDKVVEAYEAANKAGLGRAAVYADTYRLIEAEAVTRKISVIEELEEWLSIEYVPGEVGDYAERLRQVSLEGCNIAATRLAFEHGPKALLAVLAKEVDAPWATNPYGYCADKYPYEKICLPNHLLKNEEELLHAVAHEYAHVITLNLTQGHAPRWLEEAVSVLAEWNYDKEAWAEFKTAELDWYGPEELEMAFGEDDEEEVWLAYQQAGWIGRYLANCHPEEKLGEMLREHANESLWRNLAIGFRGETRTSAAIEKVYKLTLEDLFEESLDYLQSLDEP